MTGFADRLIEGSYAIMGDPLSFVCDGYRREFLLECLILKNYKKLYDKFRNT